MKVRAFRKCGISVAADDSEDFDVQKEGLDDYEVKLYYPVTEDDEADPFADLDDPAMDDEADPFEDLSNGSFTEDEDYSSEDSEN